MRAAFPSASSLVTVVILLCGAFGGLWVLAFGVGAQEPGVPDPGPPLTASRPGDAQPIAFSHRIHAGDNDLTCQFCHAYARRGPVAGLPSVQRCVQCHVTIASEAAEVGKVMAFWDAKEPIPWLRVHDLPDFVRFTHKRHVAAGVACETCHGEVAEMTAAVQVAPLTMGWCLDCHEERQAPVDCVVCHY